MLRCLTTVAAVAAAILPTFPARADLAGGVNVLSAWTRQPGSYSDDQNPERGAIVALDPYRLKVPVKSKTIFDVQYGAKGTYRGIPLTSLVKAYKGGSPLDGVILVFQNGMRIPLAKQELDRLGAFLALERCDASARNCEAVFPEAPRTDVYGDQEDPAPIAFGWNKVVVAKSSKEFSPWRHVDSLIGLEFVDMAAYRAQFSVGRSGGERVFFQRCSFCHGVRYVGASYGWDFVTPLPLYEKREPSNLLNHVKYPKAMAQRLGIRMPPQKDIGSSETQLLWNWMRDVAQTKLKPYRP